MNLRLIPVPLETDGLSSMENAAQWDTVVPLSALVRILNIIDSERETEETLSEISESEYEETEFEESSDSDLSDED